MVPPGHLGKGPYMSKANILLGVRASTWALAETTLMLLILDVRQHVQLLTCFSSKSHPKSAVSPQPVFCSPLGGGKAHGMPLSPLIEYAPRELVNYVHPPSCKGIFLGFRDSVWLFHLVCLLSRRRFGNRRHSLDESLNF